MRVEGKSEMSLECGKRIRKENVVDEDAARLCSESDVANEKELLWNSDCSNEKVGIKRDNTVHNTKSGLSGNNKKNEIMGGNSLFEWYYRTQGICKPEEYSEFLSVIKKPLPISFRVNRSHPLEELLSYALENIAASLSNNRRSEIDSPNFRRNALGRDCLSYGVYNLSEDGKKGDNYKEFREFIMHQDSFGAISKQECVSMLPSMVLDINSGDHKVLDLCSAPGSKSMHILDNMALSIKEKASVHIGVSMGSGVVLLNDVCMKRIDTLLTRVNRISSPSVIVTCIDATFIPKFVHKRTGKCLMFDRILADVPCSGDGTMRKNKDIWNNWKVEKALHLHKKQLSILSRAYKLLDIGGKLVYSTCSLNPIENEAVISSFLQKYEDALLVPCRNFVDKSFALSPGIDDWLVCCPFDPSNHESSEPSNKDGLSIGNGNGDNSHGKGRLHLNTDGNCCYCSKKCISQSMFPSKFWKEGKFYEKCVRVFPHKNDTGGFFYAVISKKPDAHKENNGFNEDDTTPDYSDPESSSGNNMSHADQYEELEDSTWTEISEFFGLCSQHSSENADSFSKNHSARDDYEAKSHTTEFPEEIKAFFQNGKENNGAVLDSPITKGNLIMKNKKNIYLINDGVRRLLNSYNVPINLKSVGIKCFEHFKGNISGDSGFNWRITQSSAPYLVRHMTKRLIFTSLDLLDNIESSDKNKNIVGEITKRLSDSNKLIGIRHFCSTDTRNGRIVLGGSVLVVITPPNVIKYDGARKVNPKFNKMSQSIPISAVLYSDHGIKLLVSQIHLRSIRELVFVGDGSMDK